MNARCTGTAVVALHGDDRAQPGSRRKPVVLSAEIAEAMGDDIIVKDDVAAAIIGVEVVTLQAWRSKGEGPKPFTVNGRARGQTVRALKEFIRQHEKA